MMNEQKVADRDLEELARKDATGAHGEARRRFAQNPDDEQRALRLRDIIRQFPASSTGTPDPLKGAAPDTLQAARLMKQGRFEDAEILLRRYLARERNDPQAMRLMALVAVQCGLLDNAYKILRRSLEIDRTRAENWAELGKVIHSIAFKMGDMELIDEAIAALDHAERLSPNHAEALFSKEAILIQARRLEEAKESLEQLLRSHPDSSYAWTNYAYVLKTLGRFGDAVAAYRTATAIDPANSEAWWNFANLKRGRFFDFDIREMEEQLGRIEGLQRIPMHFALANAYDRAGDFHLAADHVARGSRLRFERFPHDRAKLKKQVDRAISTYSPAFFEHHSGLGRDSNAPIFIIGLPRSGSTLIEQILASHSQVEGTAELFAVHQIEAKLLAESKRRPGDVIEDLVPEMDRSRLKDLGERYLQITRYHRRTERPHFTDKNPFNWRHVGFIHAILPNAKIIDARRDPMDCGFGNYMQHYSLGADYSYDLAEMAGVYREYLRLMRHFDSALPGLVHRVIHEELVDNFEAEVRRLLDYLELPFEKACLTFYETEREIHTPSSEQVRQPINRIGFGRWRNYEPWLGQLKLGLGDAIDDWRR
jgi:tetratricopeptide (TPR) repeat protein